MSSLLRIAPELPAANLRRSLEYYEVKLGFETAMTMPGGDYAIVERDGVAIHLFQAGAQSLSPVSIHIFTDGLDDLHAELQKRGAPRSNSARASGWVLPFRVISLFSSMACVIRGPRLRERSWPATKQITDGKHTAAAMAGATRRRNFICGGDPTTKPEQLELLRDETLLKKYRSINSLSQAAQRAHPQFQTPGTNCKCECRLDLSPT